MTTRLRWVDLTSAEKREVIGRLDEGSVLMPMRLATGRVYLRGNGERMRRRYRYPPRQVALSPVVEVRR